MTKSELQTRVESEFRRDINTVYHCDVDIAGDLISGILLSQIVYYYGLRTDDGKSKLRVFKDGYYWLVKGREDWKSEIRITPKQFDRAASILSEKNLISLGKFKFNGSPQIHIRLNFDLYNQELAKWKLGKAREITSCLAGENQTLPNGEMEFDETGNSFFPKGENPTSQNVNNDIPQTGKTLTETTTETTTQITTENKKETDTDKFCGHEFSEPVKEKLTEWLTYKAERKESYKPTGLKSFMTEVSNKLKIYAEDDIISLIGECMANNWRGIIWDKLKGKERKSSTNGKGGASFLC